MTKAELFDEFIEDELIEAGNKLIDLNNPIAIGSLLKEWSESKGKIAQLELIIALQDEKIKKLESHK